MLSLLYSRFCIDYFDYYELYDGSDQIFSTKIPGFAVIDKKCYRLTEDPEFQSKYLETFGDLQVGEGRRDGLLARHSCKHGRDLI